MRLKLPEELNSILIYSREEAIRLGKSEISPYHLLLGIIRHKENRACELLQSHNVNLSRLKEELDALNPAETSPSQETNLEEKITLSPESEVIFKRLFAEIELSGSASPPHSTCCLPSSNLTLCHSTRYGRRWASPQRV